MGCTTSTVALVPHLPGKPTKKKESTAATPPISMASGLESTPVSSTITTTRPSNKGDEVDASAVGIDVLADGANNDVIRTEQRRFSGSGEALQAAVAARGEGALFRTMSGAQVSSISKPKMVPMSGVLLASCLANPRSMTMSGPDVQATLDFLDPYARKTRSTMVLAAERSIHTRSFAGKLGEMQDQGKDWNDIPLDFFIDEIVDDSRGSQVRSMLANGVSRLRGSRVAKAKTSGSS